MTKTATRAVGVIRADEIYTLAEFAARARLGRYALRQAKRAGLKIITVGGKSFVRGADFFEWLADKSGDTD